MSTAGFWIGNVRLVGCTDRLFTHRTSLLDWGLGKLLEHTAAIKPMYKTEIPEHLLKCLAIKRGVMHCTCNISNIFSCFALNTARMALNVTENEHSSDVEISAASLNLVSRFCIFPHWL